MDAIPSPSSSQRRNASPRLNPHSPLRSHKAAFMNTRARAKSLGSEPLLIPQSRRTGLRASPMALADRKSASTFLMSPQLTNEPPRISDTQKIVEHAMQQERKRSKEMEKEELNMSADEMRLVLKQERHRMAGFAADLARLKSAAVQCQAESEIHEERCINGLMRRLESLQVEKGRIVVELEREEEMLTNTLQKKLNKVRDEKAELEKVIENENVEHEELERKVAQLQGKDPKPSKAEVSSATEATTKKRPLSGLGALAEIPGEEGENDEEEWQHGDAPIPR